MNKTNQHVPERTCVGCRQRAAKGELMRLVARDSEILVDHRQRLPGRGAYVHRDDKCIASAVSRGGLSRSFRRRIDASALEQVLRSEDKGQS